MVLFNKRCPECGKKVKDEWNFCPYCGELLSNDIGFGVGKISLGDGITITIQAVKPRGKVRVIKPQEARIAKPSIGAKEKQRVVKEVVEPSVSFGAENGRVVITVGLPGVSNEHDIEIKRLEESIEVKAYAKDKDYFKVISIKPSLKVVGKEFSDGTLRIYLA